MAQSLVEQTARRILDMVEKERRFLPGDKLPNENDLSRALGVSRTTLREAIRILAARRVLKIERGRGTFVAQPGQKETAVDLNALANLRPDLASLYELRLMVEPRVAYFAARRATAEEVQRILRLGLEEEELIARRLDRTQAERAFHQAFARAAHNALTERLMPIIYEAIDSGVQLSRAHEAAVEHTLRDHRMIMDFIAGRDAPGAEAAMRLHILHAMEDFGIQTEGL